MNNEIRLDGNTVVWVARDLQTKSEAVSSCAAALDLLEASGLDRAYTFVDARDPSTTIEPGARVEYVKYLRDSRWQAVVVLGPTGASRTMASVILKMSGMRHVMIANAPGDAVAWLEQQGATPLTSIPAGAV